MLGRAVSQLAVEMERIAGFGADVAIVESTAVSVQRLQAATAAPVVVLNGCAHRGREADEAAEALGGLGAQVPGPDRSARGVRPVPAGRPRRSGSRAGRQGCR